MKRSYVSKAVELRASTNGKKKITDHELANIITEVDKNTTNDEQFQLQLIKQLYKFFGWSYFTQEEMKDNKNKITVIKTNYKNAN